MLAEQNTLDRYKIIRELGRGAIGTVYAARDRSTGAVVALKTLDPALFGESDANLAELFLKNARSAGQLRHRNIVRIHDAGEVDGTVYVAMELLVGESLRSMLDNRPLSIARAIQIFDDIASALAYAHEEGIVHRGVRPSNIMVLRSGVAKISDFGIGQIGEAARRYMSPDQVRGGSVDHRSDLFSLGAVFYEMLTRRVLFDGSSPKEIMENILHAEPPLPSAVNPHVPSALDGIIASLLAGHPEERVADARILLRDLQRIEEGLGLGPGTGAGSGESIARLPGGAEPKPRTPAANQSHDREVPHETTSPPRVQTEPAARRRTTDPEPGPRTPDPDALPKRSSGSRPAGLAALVLMLAVLGLTVFSYYSPGPSEPRTAAVRMQEAPATAAATAAAAPEALPPRAMGDARAEQESLAIASAPNPLPPKPLVAEPGPSARTESLSTRESESPATASTAPAHEAPRAPQPRAKISKPQPGGTARLIVAVSPHGELYIDGKHHGTTPPIKMLVLEPGMHRIEIRSGSRKPYLTYVVVQAGEQRRVRHDFGAKPSNPPI
jgi:serine/threonine protein kinase